MINAGTAVLLALLVHLGGVDLDRSDDARLIWYRDSVPAAEWRLSSHSAGTYRFVGENEVGILVVERLRGAGVVYTLLQYVVPAHSLESPELQSPVTIGTVALDGVAESLRSVRPGATLTPDRDGISVAWMESSTETGDGADNESQRNVSATDAEIDSGEARDETPAAAQMRHAAGAPSGLTVSIQSSRLSASDTETSQVLVLSLR